MIIVNETNSRNIYCTVKAEFQVSETYDHAIAAHNLYNYGLLVQGSYPFIMDMILYHDITLVCAAKPLPTSIWSHAILTAQYSSLVAKKYDLPADSWQHQFLQFLREAIPKISQFGENDFAVIDPLITVYNQPAKSFCLTD